MGSTFRSNVRSPLTVSSIVFLMSGLASVLVMAPRSVGRKGREPRRLSDSIPTALAAHLRQLLDFMHA